MHPFEPLTADEIEFATKAVRPRLSDGALFSTVYLDEPPKDLVDRVRMARVNVVPGPASSVVEASVRLDTGEIVEWQECNNARPAMLFDESFKAVLALYEDDAFKAALEKRGITDLSKVQVDPWPTGNFGIAAEDGRRVARCLSYYREEPTDNGYARPIEGLLAWVDMARGEVLDVQDYGAVPIPTDPGSYYPEHNPGHRPLKPFEITQPEGPSFSVDGSLITWDKWSLRASMHPLEGLVLHQVSFDGRSIMYRGAISEMVVPYGDPSPMHNFKNAFDAGEWGLGRMANTLKNGCDCLGEIRYLDFVYSDEQGNPATTENAICIHEEDYGILWKHVDLHGGRTEVRRSRRLVVSFIATVGNYEYGFYWYFYLDGSIQLEVKLTGIMSTRALDVDETTPYAPTVAAGVGAPVHQHMFCARLDLDIDGDGNEVYEVNVDPVPTSTDNPAGNAFLPTATLLASEQDAQRVVDPARSRAWKIVNPNVRNGLGQPVAYKLLPGPTPTLLSQPDASITKRATFATKNLWVTPYVATERRAAGDYPCQHIGGDGLPKWTAADRSLVNRDVVVWYSFGVTHVPRPEDFPVMPVEYCGFSLIPVGFFDKNPALDVAPPDHCEH
jgi:primary-amine oxidase